MNSLLMCTIYKLWESHLMRGIIFLNILSIFDILSILSILSIFSVMSIFSILMMFENIIKILNQNISNNRIFNIKFFLNKIKKNLKFSGNKIKIHVKTDIGKRPNMEDYYTSFKIMLPIILNNDPNAVIKKEFLCICICDGHGGSEFAKYTIEKMMKELKYIKNLDDEQIINFMENFDKNAISELHKFNYCGTTLVMSLIDIESKNIITINIGDSLGVLLKKDSYIPITYCHNTFNIKERERLKNLGAHLQYIGNHNGDQIFRICGLIPTRVIGDKIAKNTGWVTSIPHISRVQYIKGDKLILATDGLWDECDFNFIQKYIELIPYSNNLANDLVDYALAKGSSDNITVIVISF